MTHFFYFILLAPLLWELIVISNPASAGRFVKSINKKEFKDYSDTQKALAFCFLFYSIFIFIGLFSSQWVLFALLFGLSMIPKKWVIVRWIDAFLSFTILLFILVNKYHLHIDIPGLIKEYFL